MNGFKLGLIFLILELVRGQENPCSLKDNCEECLGANFKCTWCTDKDFPLTALDRCMLKDDLIKNNCQPTEILENYQENEIQENVPIEDYQIEKNRAVQIQPQKIKLKLVKGEPQQIKMTYRPAKNNPLDIYYLMDLTWSMKDDKETLVKIGENLAKPLRSLTENYRLGFGSFADKPAMPMAMPGYEENPCKIERAVCEPTYGFRHHLALTNNIKDFVRTVNESKVTGNLDNLEGQLDALMQVIVCNDQIGWKEDARKVVVLVTDGFMHFAGDGMLAGATLRNDKKCHLNADGEYEGTLVYDYPSLEEIYRELTKRKISVIFAVTENVSPTYYRVKDLMKQISAVGILSKDSSNIIDLIKQGHQSFIEKVQFEDTSPSFIKIDYSTDCGGLLDKIKNINFCNNIEIGKIIDFYINVTVIDFPSDGNYTHRILIEEASLSENLEIEIEIQKPCPCTKELTRAEPNRNLCSEHGNFHCGMCLCDQGWLGSICSCDSLNYTTNRALEDQCRKNLPNSNNELGQICSNHGECDCGKCHCQSDFTGKYCECPKCERCDPEREECHCGLCVCKYGWSGSLCNCRTSTEGCESPIDNSICSNRGICKCGKCDCDESFFGKLCETSSSAGNMFCSYYESCVKCLVHQRQGTKSKECKENFQKLCSSSQNIDFSYNFTTNEFENDLKCLVRLPSKASEDVKCDHYFIYDTDKTGISYLTVKIDNCGPTEHALFLGFGIFALTILLGVIGIIIFKVNISIKDKRECAKFEEEAKKANFEMQSPIYKNPITHYSIPKLDEQ